jgi:hypothetical protein
MSVSFIFLIIGAIIVGAVVVGVIMTGFIFIVKEIIYDLRQGEYGSLLGALFILGLICLIIGVITSGVPA